MSSAEALAASKSQLVLRFLKHRWLKDVRDLLERAEGPGFDDLDLDQDLAELLRAVGRDAVTRTAGTLLELREPLPDDSPALDALRPELEGEPARGFLHLVAVNLAFRLRSDALLGGLIAHGALGPPPRLDAARLGALLVRARSLRRARALVEAAALSDGAREELLAALRPLDLDLGGARLHVEASQAALEEAVQDALPDLEPVAFHEPAPEQRRFVLLRRRGGFTTLLEEGEGRPDPELAATLARTKRIGRVAWVSFPEGDEDGDADLRVIEQTRTLVDRPQLMARIGGEPTTDDVAGELRALGILDYDPSHPRGRAELQFAAHARSRKKGERAFALGKRMF